MTNIYFITICHNMPFYNDKRVKHLMDGLPE